MSAYESIEMLSVLADVNTLNHLLVAAPGLSKQIVVVGYEMNTDAGGDAFFVEDPAGTPVTLTPLYICSINTNLKYSAGPQEPCLFKCAVNTALGFSVGGGLIRTITRYKIVDAF